MPPIRPGSGTSLNAALRLCRLVIGHAQKYANRAIWRTYSALTRVPATGPGTDASLGVLVCADGHNALALKSESMTTHRVAEARFMTSPFMTSPWCTGVLVSGLGLSKPNLRA